MTLEYSPQNKRLSRIHFIAIGGAAMHNLAIALYRKGHRVTGSDDEIHEPSRSRLAELGLLPQEEGWFPSRITPDLDAVVLGMHAKRENPELKRALKLGISVLSFPEFLYSQTQEKTRVVLGGSHGKTTITSLVLHCLRFNQINADYLVGAQIDGFDTMVGLDSSSDLAVFEGDEYLTSPLDPKPKFLHYRPHLALISGISWDHANVFPTAEIYRKQFALFINCIEKNGTVIYYENDSDLSELVHSIRSDLIRIPYRSHPHQIKEDGYYLKWKNQQIKTGIFGRHNMQNIAGAKEVCLNTGISEEQFYDAIPSFKGAARRLETVYEDPDCTVFLDFAHSPSKVKATIEAVRQLFPGRKLIACLELHTFSSLNADFIPQYHSKMDGATLPIVFYDPETVEQKGLPPLDPEKIVDSFGNKELRVFDNIQGLENLLLQTEWKNASLLMMTSGMFAGLDLKKLVEKKLKSLG